MKARNLSVLFSVVDALEQCLAHSRPWWFSGKGSACSARDAGDVGSVPGLGRFPRGRHGNPFQYSCLKNPTDRWTWQSAVHGIAESNMTSMSMNIVKWMTTSPLLILEFLCQGCLGPVPLCKESWHILWPKDSSGTVILCLVQTFKLPLFLQVEILHLFSNHFTICSALCQFSE